MKQAGLAFASTLTIEEWKAEQQLVLGCPCKAGGITADTSTLVAGKHAVPVNVVPLPNSSWEEEHHLRTAKCFTQVTNSLAWIATPVSSTRVKALQEADANGT